MISQRISQVSPSITLAISAKAKEMKKQGLDVIGFGAGEPDFDTPQHIKEACIKALENGITKYTPASGTVELKEAVREKFLKDNGLEYSIKEIIICCGAKHALYNAIQVLCSEGDEVLLPSPYWVSYIEQIRLAGAQPVVVRTTPETDFKVIPEILEEQITPRTKLLILNSPSNPTGSVYSQEELEDVAAIALRHNFFIISDEIYEKILYDGLCHVSIAALSADIKKKTIVINGLSKSYSMTGWRIGYAAGHEGIIKAMSNLQSHSTSNPTSFAQTGAVAALTGPQEVVGEMVREFARRRDHLIKRLGTIAPISCTRPQGAFYAFPSIRKVLGRRAMNDSMSFCDALLEKEKVAVVPGEAFGHDDHIRLSYATSIEHIDRGLDRIARFIEGLS
ncbi:MAG: pyridoxal phosphate-dependent aminotransferase [Candidatus Omnitrophica bacterium]|nr:pyridoxal phosphate-dependent aminotransferase [Candidatus Omnitrophota bacterium]